MTENLIKDIYIQLMKSEKTDWLQEHFTNSYILLTYMARKALRYPDLTEGLEAGDLIVGEIETSRKSGLSKKEYRNALEKLEELGFIETVYNEKWNTSSYLENCKKIGVSPKCQKRAIKRAIKSKVVCLINSEICNINIQHKGELKVELGANLGRQRKNEEEMKESSFSLNKEMKMKEEKKIISVSFSDIKEKEIFENFSAISDLAKIPIKPFVLQRWVRIYSEKIIDETFNEFVKKQDFQGNHEAWIEKTLSNKHNFIINYQWIIEFKRQHNIYYLDLLKNYCRDIETGNDYQYSLPHVNFTETIQNMHARKKERELAPV